MGDLDLFLLRGDLRLAGEGPLSGERRRGDRECLFGEGDNLLCGLRGEKDLRRGEYGDLDLRPIGRVGECLGRLDMSGERGLLLGDTDFWGDTEFSWGDCSLSLSNLIEASLTGDKDCL